MPPADPHSLVNAVLVQSQNVRDLKESIDRMMLMLRPLVNTADELNATFVHELRAKLDRLVNRLDVLTDNVKDVEREVTDARIDTSRHQLADKEDQAHGITKIIHALDKIQTRTWLFMLALVAVAAATGWLRHLWHTGGQ